jgi:hypothetical protein
MAFLESQLVDIRRFCGYPVYGVGASGFQGWRFFQAYGLLEYRMQNLAPEEETVVLNYLSQLHVLECGVTGVATHLDTAQASVWTRNPQELRERVRLFDEWRRRLCGFMGVPPGPALGDGNFELVV